ncbi:MAG: DUF2505 domain-containing protein, partial [Bifidobacteriaceae bacterium]|nr:DUF2505 domain-containing protein [Bifidobacteriaceae bacterium]
MKLTSASQFAASPTRIAGILADPEFASLTPSETMTTTADVTGSPDGPFTVTTRRTLPRADLPDQVRTFLPGGLDVRQANAWEAPGPDGSRSGTVAVDVTGAPVRVSASVRLTASDGGALLEYNVDLRVTVPLVGGRLAESLAPVIT